MSSLDELVRVHQARFGTREGGPRSTKNLAESYQAGQKHRQESQKRMYDAYQVLRDAGYDPETASRAAQAGSLPTTKPTGVSKNDTSQSYDRLKAKILTKMAQGEPLTVGEQKVYNQVLRGGDEASHLVVDRMNATSPPVGGSGRPAPPTFRAGERRMKHGQVYERSPDGTWRLAS